MTAITKSFFKEKAYPFIIASSIDSVDAGTENNRYFIANDFMKDKIITGIVVNALTDIVTNEGTIAGFPWMYDNNWNQYSLTLIDYNDEPILWNYPLYNLCKFYNSTTQKMPNFYLKNIDMKKSYINSPQLPLVGFGFYFTFFYL